MARDIASDTVERYRVVRAGLPLAVYRELAAHLCQANGVTAALEPQTATQFEYALGQVGALWFGYQESAPPESRDRVARILAYYRDRFGGEWTIEPAM